MTEAEQAKAKAEAEAAFQKWDARFKEAATGLTSWPTVSASMGLDVFKRDEKMILKAAAKHKFKLANKKPYKGTIMFHGDQSQAKTFQETYEYMTKGKQ